MKRFTKQYLCLGMIGLAASLVGCSSNKVDPYDLDFSVDTKGTTIDFWTGFGSDMQDYVQALCETFTEETGINVNLETKGGYDALNKAITLGASTLSIPEVALAYPDHEASYVNMDIIVRLDYYFANDGDDNYKMSDFYSDYLVENQTIEKNGEGGYYTLGVPFNKSTEVMCYNKTFFDWAGKLDSNIYVPLTWDDVATVGPRITKFLSDGGYFGKILCDDGKKYDSSQDIPSGVNIVLDFSAVTKAEQFRPICYDSQANYFITTCRQWGGKYTEYDADAQKGYLAFNSDEVKTGLQYMQDAHTNGAVSIPNEFGGTGKYSSSYFKNMQSVIAIGSSAGVANLCPTGNSFKVDVAPIPYKDADHKYVISQGTNLCMLDVGSKVQRVAAWKLIKYLSKEANGLFSALSGYYPSCEYATNSQDYQDALSRNNPEGKTGSSVPSLAHQLMYYTAKINSDYYLKSSEKWTKFTDPGFVGSSTIRTAVGTAMGLLFIDNKTPTEVINSYYTNSELKDYVR